MRFLAVWRLFYFALYTLLRIAQILLLNLIRGESMARAMSIRRSWARHLLPQIGVRLSVKGEPPTTPCLILGNHRSYLDPILLIHDVLACPVSKAEVAHWPIVGYGARVTGILFLRRESASSRKITLQGIADQVKKGWSVILFPEGTTHAEPVCQTFKYGSFKLAAQEQIPIVPVAIEYRHEADYWIGNDTFLPHFLRRFSKPTMQAWVHYGPIMRDDDPQALLDNARAWINQELVSIQKSFV